MESSKTIVGVDTAKRVFQLYWVEQDTGEEHNVRLSRAKFLRHFAKRVPCLVSGLRGQPTLGTAAAGTRSRGPDHAGQDGSTLCSRQ